MKDDYYDVPCERCGVTGVPLQFNICGLCFAKEKTAMLRDLADARRMRRRHRNIMGLLVGNPAANAVERLRHLHIEELLAA